jgi:hypothetical protein
VFDTSVNSLHSSDLLMIDSGAGVCVCPLNYAEEVPLEEVPHTQRPKLSTATGKTITVYGKRCVKYRVDHSLTLSITYWVCDVQHHCCLLDHL